MKVKKVSLLHNNLGLSIMEVVIAAGLMGGVALGVMQLQKTTTNMQLETAFTAETNALDQDLTKTFFNRDICKGTLLNAGNILAADGTDANQVTIPSVDYVSYDDTGAEVDRNQLIVPNDENYRGVSLAGRFHLTNISVYNLVWVEAQAPASDLRRAELTIRAEFERRKCAGCTDPNDIRISYKFYKVDAMVDVNTGLVDTCFNSVGNAVTTALKQACESQDFDNDGTPDRIFDEVTMQCVPATGESECLYGGSFARGGASTNNYLNPNTNTLGCPPGYTPVKSGHFMRPQSYACGKNTCYRFYQQVYYNCVKCYGFGAPGFQGTYTQNAGAGTVTGYYGCDSPGDCTAGADLQAFGDSTVAPCQDTVDVNSCGAQNEFPYDSDGDGCDDACGSLAELQNNCPQPIVTCDASQEPQDPDGDGCIDACL